MCMQNIRGSDLPGIEIEVVKIYNQPKINTLESCTNNTTTIMRMFTTLEVDF
jgi:hypothetical protein